MIVEAIATGSLVKHRGTHAWGVVVAQARMNVNLVVVHWLTGEWTRHSPTREVLMDIEKVENT